MAKATERRILTDAEIAALPYRACVGLMVLNRRGEVFAGQRIDNPGEAWQMPQGGIDDGEAPLQAAYRELGEETGIAPERVELLAESRAWRPYDLPAELIPHLWKGRYRGQMQRWFAMRFLGEDHEIDIATEHQEFRAWSWVPHDKVLSLIVPFKREIYTHVFDEFRDILTEA
jgi:putative (di)nucleoside polyphosphate hydrolase